MLFRLRLKFTESFAVESLLLEEILHEMPFRFISVQWTARHDREYRRVRYERCLATPARCHVTIAAAAAAAAAGAACLHSPVCKLVVRQTNVLSSDGPGTCECYRQTSFKHLSK